MSSNEDRSRQLNILLLYQGEYATDPRNKITKFFSEQSQMVTVKTVAQGDATLDNTAFKEFVSLVPQCHAAVALLTPDYRNASAAGNLWFEIGYWLATKPTNTIMILEIEGLEKTKSVNLATNNDEPPIIEMISNLRGLNYKKVKFKDEWLQGLWKFIEERGQLGSDEDKKKETEEKVFRWVFQHIPDAAGLKDLSQCRDRDSADSQCQFRRKALIFAAELLAMFKVAEKHFLLEDVLRRISFHLSMLIDLGHQENQALYWLRDSYAKELCHDFTEFEELRTLLKKELNKSFGGWMDFDDWVDLLENRITHHRKNWDQAVSTAVSRLPTREPLGMKGEILSTRIEEFFKWGKDFQGKIGTSKYLAFCTHGIDAFKDDKDELEWWQDLENQKNFSSHASQLLLGWSIDFYTRWHEEIGKAIRSKESFHEIMSRLLDALPHRQENTPYERVWLKKSLL